jgi:hypothetical protein
VDLGDEFVEVVLLDGGAEFCIGLVVDGDEFLLIDMVVEILAGGGSGAAMRKANSFEFRVGTAAPSEGDSMSGSTPSPPSDPEARTGPCKGIASRLRLRFFAHPSFRMCEE